MGRKRASKSRFRKILKWGTITVIGLVALLIVAAVAIPYLFKDKLLERAKKEINKNINATVDFGEVSLSLIKNFPELTFGIKDVSVVGIEQFDGVKLASIESLDLSMDVMSVVNSGEGTPIGVNSIGLVKPDINIIVLKDGTANYDIAKDSGKDEPTEASEPMAFKLNLSEYFIKDGQFVYDDKQGGTYLKIVGLNHNGSGNFTEAIYDIATRTKIDQLTAYSGGTPYLTKARLDADMTVNADMNNMKFTLKDNSIKVNALQINADGWVQTEGNNLNMDVKFDAPSSSFKHLLSMIPGAYTKDFEGVVADGTFKFNGNAKGTLNEKRIPAFNVNLNVADGSFKYPDLPLGMKDIGTNIKLSSPSSDMDKMTIDIPQFHMLLGQNPFDVQLKLRTPISDPDVDAVMKGILNMEELAQAFPLEGVTSLKGIVTADVAAKTKMSYIDKKQYDKVDMKGKLQIDNIDYIAEGMPPVLVKTMKLDFTPQNVKLENFDAKLGKSDVQADGTLDNILAYFSPGKTMTGKLKLRSAFFDANEWISEESSEPTPQASTPKEGEEEVEIFEDFKFVLDAKMDKILYEDYELLNTVAKGSFTPEEIKLESLGTKMGKSDIVMDGNLDNVFGYLFDNEMLGGNINLKSKYLDVNELMGYQPSSEPVSPTSARKADGTPEPTTTSSEGSDIVLVPDNMNLTVNTDVGEIIYDNIRLKNFKGRVAVANEKVSLEDVYAKLLGGEAKILGSYDTKDPKKPLFDFGYDIKKFDFQKSFKTFNTFQSAAPIGEYIKGIFNSKMSVNGVMGKGMMPDLNTISAVGDLHTVNALIQNFIPFKSIGERLNVKYFNDDIRVIDTKNFFKIKNGKVVVDEFPFKYKGMKMKVGGAHGFDQNIDYTMKVELPRSMLGSGQVAGIANSGLDFLDGFASQAGFSLKKMKLGDKVHITLQLTGPMKKPNVKVTKVSLTGDDGEPTSVKDALMDEVKDIVDDKIEEVKTIVDDKVDEVKTIVDDKVDEVRTIVDDKVDEVRTIVDDKVDEVKDQVKDQVTDQVKEQITDKVDDKVDEVMGDKVDEVKDQVDDKIKDALEGKTDDIKDNLDNWNPWKKKKKDD